MNATEKIVLKQISRNLEASTRVNWTTGDLEKWADWAKKMRTVIEASHSLIDELCKVDESAENTSNKEPLSLG